MPYVNKHDRHRYRSRNGLNPTLEGMGLSVGQLCNNGGEFNYVLSVAMATFVCEKGLCYDTIQDVMGMLEVAKAEFIARVVLPYEQIKAAENGAEIYDDLEMEIRKKWQDWNQKQSMQSGK